MFMTRQVPVGAIHITALKSAQTCTSTGNLQKTLPFPAHKTVSNRFVHYCTRLYKVKSRATNKLNKYTQNSRTIHHTIWKTLILVHTHTHTHTRNKTKITGTQKQRYRAGGNRIQTHCSLVNACTVGFFFFFFFPWLA